MKNQKIHRPLIEAIVPVLTEIFGENQYTDQALEKAFKANRKWGSRDRKFVAEQVYEMVRWWRKYWFLLGSEPVLNRIFLLRLWGIRQLDQGLELPPWPEFEELHFGPEKREEANRRRAIRESIPDWLDEVGQKELGSRWDSILHSLNQSASVDLRVNHLRASRAQVQKELMKEGIETKLIPNLDDGLELIQRKNLTSSRAFLAGHFEVQDRASQQVAPLMKLESGLRVVDACAGSGGKTLHIATMMKNRGKILSMDIHDWKLRELKNRAIRHGLDIVETKLIDDSSLIRRMEKSADRVLLDVPCSGLGTLRRKPDIKWKLSPEELLALTQKQSEILQAYSQMTKTGGYLVYATCSFLPSENEAQVEAFLSRHPTWTLEESLRIDPDQDRGDGFFAARLHRGAD